MFWSSYVLLSLHVWMVIHRLRGSASPDVKVLRQRFYNAFQQDVEFRVYASGLQVCIKAGVWVKGQVVGYNAFQQDVEFRVYASGLQVCIKDGVWVKGQVVGYNAFQQDVEFRVCTSGLQVGARVLTGRW